MPSHTLLICFIDREYWFGWYVSYCPSVYNNALYLAICALPFTTGLPHLKFDHATFAFDLAHSYAWHVCTQRLTPWFMFFIFRLYFVNIPFMSQGISPQHCLFKHLSVDCVLCALPHRPAAPGTSATPQHPHCHSLWSILRAASLAWPWRCGGRAGSIE